METNKKPKLDMPKFNMNWVYLIILIVLGILFFTNNSTDNSASAEES